MLGEKKYSDTLESKFKAFQNTVGVTGDFSLFEIMKAELIRFWVPTNSNFLNEFSYLYTVFQGKTLKNNIV